MQLSVYIICLGKSRFLPDSPNQHSDKAKLVNQPIRNGIPIFVATNAFSTKESRQRAKSEGKIAVSATDSYFDGFKDVEAWLTQIPDQFDGLASPSPANGYTEIYSAHSFVDTLEGRAFAENIVANEIAHKLLKLFEEADGPIYWRERLEYETFPITIIDKFQKDGSFYHPLSDRMCEVKSWRCACTKAYCRLTRIPKSSEQKQRKCA